MPRRSNRSSQSTPKRSGSWNATIETLVRLFAQAEQLRFTREQAFDALRFESCSQAASVVQSAAHALSPAKSSGEQEPIMRLQHKAVVAKLPPKIRIKVVRELRRASSDASREWHKGMRDWASVEKAITSVALSFQEALSWGDDLSLALESPASRNPGTPRAAGRSPGKNGPAAWAADLLSKKKEIWVILPPRDGSSEEAEEAAIQAARPVEDRIGRGVPRGAKLRFILWPDAEMRAQGVEHLKTAGWAVRPFSAQARTPRAAGNA